MSLEIIRLEDRFSYLIHRASARIAQIGNFHFQQQDLNHYSARMLVLLLQHGRLRTGELVDLMVLPQSTISTQLAALHKRRLITRRRSRQDNRAVIVSLTPTGEVVAKDCDQLSRIVQEELAKEMSDAEYSAGCAFLTKVEERLRKMEGRKLYDFHASSVLAK
ncbi:MarR family transcriptional regulator (plasmid) [Variovorax sp. WS11]|nr:MarR family transcriptional regulator [Variovorax sp. WS11]